jgi:DNA polymerase-4
MARVLFHIDLNAFFASAEELRHPEYKNKPLAVGSLSSRGVLSTANYEARKHGIHSAMPTMQAKSLCPELIIVPGDHEYYRKLSAKFFAYLRQYSSALEPVSIDECFLDVTETIKKYRRPLDLAVSIQQGVYETLGLKCSIGVAPNRFLAKMASDMRKPMGITVLRKSEIEAKLWPLPIEKMMGIGIKTVPKLKEAGIERIGDLANPENEKKIYAICKKNGYKLIQNAKGNSSDQLNFSDTRKSISLSRTFNNDIYTLDEVLYRLQELTRELCFKMAKEKQKGKLVSLIFRDTQFKNKMHSVRLNSYTNQYEPIYQALSSLADEYFEPVGYRYLAISIGSLQNGAGVEQPTIFEPVVQTSQDVINQLNKQIPDAHFMKASDLLKKKEEKNES